MIKIALLGALQGLTEFLPVSSSGHLVLAQHAFGMTKDIVFLDTLLHVGTILAILTFFYKDIGAALRNRKTIGLICLVTIITGSIGLTFKTAFESLFVSPRCTAVFLIANATILLLTRLSRNRQRTPGVLDSLLMGAVQGLAITPGISRSGSTIATLLFRGVKTEEAFRFSFLASIPAILGAFLWEAKDAQGISTYGTGNLLAGVSASYLFGLISLAILKRSVQHNKLHYFGYYCLAAGAAGLFLIR